MPYTILLTPTAIDDIDAAVEYYNALATDLGYRFAGIIDQYFERIAEVPTASAVRYKNVRCKPVARFPYVITYTIDEAASSVNILRVFNTYQQPIWLTTILKDNNIDKKTVQEIADEVGLSRVALQYGFKKLFGASIFEYQLFRRMSKAYDLLLGTDKTIKEIARLVGYKSVTSFSMAVKKYFGNPPIFIRNRPDQSSPGKRKN